MELDLQHDSASPGGRARIEMTLRLGGDLAPEQLARIRAVSARCPVHRMLAGGVDIVEG